MKYTFAGIVAALLIVVLFACGKDKFETTPTIRVKDMNTTEVNAPDGILKVTLEVTDREGDAAGGDLTYIRVRTNGTPIPDPVNNDKADTAHATVPSYPKTDKVEMVLTIPYSFMDEDPVRNDTMYFKLTLRDSQNHQSDTITTKSVVAVQ
jgi:hypothetical protein